MKVVNLRDYPRDTVKYIGRGSALGNPFTNLPLERTKAYVRCDTVESAIGCCEAWARGSPAWDGIIPPVVRARFLTALMALRGDELLACYCQDSMKCHGQVIMRLWLALQSKEKL
jgi:hypothetical protein